MACSVMAAQEDLALLVRVRVLARQPIKVVCYRQGYASSLTKPGFTNWRLLSPKI